MSEQRYEWPSHRGRGRTCGALFDGRAYLDADTYEVVAELLRVVAERDHLAGFETLFGEVALALKCLPSSFPDANGHVLEKAKNLEAQRDALGKALLALWQKSGDYAMGAPSLTEFGRITAGFQDAYDKAEGALRAAGLLPKEEA